MLQVAAAAAVTVLVSWRKSSKTVLLHLGHFGSFSESMTYIRHRGHPTNTMEVASGLLGYPSSTLISDTQELGGDVGETVADRLGEELNPRFILGGDRFSFSSSFDPFLRLILPVGKKDEEEESSVFRGGEKTKTLLCSLRWWWME